MDGDAPGAGAPTFLPPVTYTTGVYPVAVAVGDLNGDGHADLAVATQGNGPDEGGVSVLFNKGNGTFDIAAKYATGSGSGSVAIGDLNGDGKPDLAVANSYDRTVSVLLNSGADTFSPAIKYVASDIYNTFSVALGDINGDGALDIVTANNDSNYKGYVSVLLNSGDGRFCTVLHLAAGVDPTIAFVGDLNGDGRIDIAVRNTCGFTVLLAQGNGAYSTISTAAGTILNGMTVGDLNGDGRADLAFASYGAARLSVFMNEGTGTFGAPVIYSAARPVAVAFGDLNSDGKVDLATATEIGGTSVLLNTGAGMFGGMRYYSSDPNEPNAVAIADLNGDGKNDLIATFYNDVVRVRLNNSP